MENLLINECEIYDKLINKLENIKNNLEIVKKYSSNIDNNKSIQYIETLNKISKNIIKLESISLDVLDEYIYQTNTELLTNEDKIKQKQIKISKQIEKVFTPYMLYLQIILENNLEN